MAICRRVLVRRPRPAWARRRPSRSKRLAARMLPGGVWSMATRYIGSLRLAFCWAVHLIHRRGRAVGTWGCPRWGRRGLWSLVWTMEDRKRSVDGLAEVAELVDATVSKTVGGKLPCRFESGLRHQISRVRRALDARCGRSMRAVVYRGSVEGADAEWCNGSTRDFGSLGSGSSPGSAARRLRSPASRHSPVAQLVERAAVNR